MPKSIQYLDSHVQISDVQFRDVRFLDTALTSYKNTVGKFIWSSQLVKCMHLNKGWPQVNLLTLSVQWTSEFWTSELRRNQKFVRLVFRQKFVWSIWTLSIRTALMNWARSVWDFLVQISGNCLNTEGAVNRTKGTCLKTSSDFGRSMYIAWRG